MNRKHRDVVTMRNRTRFALKVIIAVFALLMLRLTWIMTVKSEEYRDAAMSQWTNTQIVEAQRGDILDRNGETLATSINVYRVEADLNTLRNTIETNNLDINEVSRDIAEILDMDTEEVYSKLTASFADGTPMGSATIKRRVEKSEKDAIEEYKEERGLYGIRTSPDTMRYYPQDDFASHVIGHTNSDGDGLTGVELIYDSLLSGYPGVMLYEGDAGNRELPYSMTMYTPPVDGYDVQLTIDSNIQGFAEKAAEETRINQDAKEVTVMIMDPNTGEVLALANSKEDGYNLNDPWMENVPGSEDLTFDEYQAMWRNRAVSDTFEPGSIFKVITLVAALGEGMVHEDDSYVCTGHTTVLGKTVRCHNTNGHGVQNTDEIFMNSCNVGFVELGLKVGAKNLNKYIDLFGFGQTTGIDLPGEAAGIIKNTKDITDLDLATIAFGQTNTVTITQFMQAFNALANGGTLITPHVMKQVIDYDEYGNQIIVQEYSDYDEKRIIDEEIAEELRRIMEKTVSEGGGQNVYIEGYEIAGKTGTAQKIDTENGGYRPATYISTFIGMAPASDPQYTVLVSIDEPNVKYGYYAGQIAAPAAKGVFEDLFNYAQLGNSTNSDSIVIPEVRGLTIEEATSQLRSEGIQYSIDGEGKYVDDINPKPGYTIAEGSEVIIYTTDSETKNNRVVVPELEGYTREEAEELLEELELVPYFTGEGVISKTVPKGGTTIEQGASITVYLEEEE